MLNLYINDSYKLLVNTWLFLTFDLYVMEFQQRQIDGFFRKYSEDLFKNEVDIDLMQYYYNPIKIIDAVESVDDKVSIPLKVTNQKMFRKIQIASHNDIYKFDVNTDIEHMYVVLMKRFDKNNYICPITIEVDKEYLESTRDVKPPYQRSLDLRFMTQELNNVPLIKNTMSTFSKIILI